MGLTDFPVRGVPGLYRNHAVHVRNVARTLFASGWNRRERLKGIERLHAGAEASRRVSGMIQRTIERAEAMQAIENGHTVH